MVIKGFHISRLILSAAFKVHSLTPLLLTVIEVKCTDFSSDLSRERIYRKDSDWFTESPEELENQILNNLLKQMAKIRPQN